MSTERDLIYHICTEEAWADAMEKGEYRADSLDEVGFIHASTKEQVVGVANRFYRHLDHLMVLWIDVRRLVSEVRWEQVEDGVFPHIYGPVNLDAVVDVSRLVRNSAGEYIWG